MAKATAEDRLGRLLTIVPWVAERGGATVNDVAEFFGLSPDDVVRDLFLVQCCEIPPYGPDNTIGIALIDDDIFVQPGVLFDRPLRLGPPEAFGLLTAGRAALEVPGADPRGVLASALAKLEVALGEHVPVAVDFDQPEFLVELQTAVEARHRLDIDYYAASRDEVTSRAIDPLTLHNQDGSWYVRAFCHRAEAVRTFRVDRIEAVSDTGVSFDADAVATEHAGTDFAPGDDAVEAIVELPATAGWVLETYPVRAVSETPDGWRVTLAVSSPIWLERLLLRVGPGARVVEPAEFVDLGPTAARRLLALYET